MRSIHSELPFTQFHFKLLGGQFHVSIFSGYDTKGTPKLEDFSKII